MFSCFLCFFQYFLGLFDDSLEIVELDENILNDIINDMNNYDDDEIIVVDNEETAVIIPQNDMQIVQEVNEEEVGAAAHEIETRLKRKRKLEKEKINQQISTTPKLHCNQNTYNCVICIQPVDMPCSTICGHIFCCKCITEAIKVFRKCPICNQKLKVGDMHRVYF